MTAPRHRPYPVPGWARRGALRWTWLGGRPLAWYKRAGARVETYTWLEDWYAHCFSETTLRRLHDAGFNLVTLPYFAGFGMVTESGWMDLTETVASHCQRQGLRALAAVDVGGFCLETLPDEEPEALDWIHREPQGQLCTVAPEQYWRGRPDFTHPGCREYLAQVIDRALRAGFDGIWLQDVEPRRGQAPAAVADWQRFLGEHTDFYRRKCGYRPGQLLAPPPYEVPGDPLWLDWDDFWQQRFEDSLAHLNQVIKTVGGDRLFVVSGPFQEHHPWERYRLHVDAIHVCSAWAPGVEHGEVVSHAALYLLGDAAELLAFGDGFRRHGNGFADPPADRAIDLALTEGLFYGGQSCSAAWATLPEGNQAAAPWAAALGRVEPWHCAFERADRFAAVQRVTRFLQRTQRLHETTASAATIAILHSRDSLRFEREATILNLRAAQLACLRRHLPADVLVSDDLSRLARYDVLVVPEQPCLAQAAVERVAAWVRAGGGLVLVGEAAVRARRGRLRPPDQLAATLGLAGTRWSLPNAEVVDAGDGRVLALPALGVEPFAYPVDAPDPSAGWEWLPDAIHDVSAWPLPVTLDGPDTLFCRGYWLANGNLVVMLLNYQVELPADDVVLRLNLDWPTGVPSAVFHSPGLDDGVELQPRCGRDVTVPLPRIDVYAVVEVRASALAQRRGLAAEEALPERV